jgi:hypothetical protein
MEFIVSQYIIQMSQKTERFPFKVVQFLLSLWFLFDVRQDDSYSGEI